MHGPAEGGVYVTTSPVTFDPVVPVESDKIPQVEFATASGAGITVETVRNAGWDLGTLCWEPDEPLIVQFKLDAPLRSFAIDTERMMGEPLASVRGLLL